MSVEADVAAAAAALAGQGAAPAPAADTTPVSGEQTAEALHGRSPEESGEHDQGQGRGRDELGRYTPRLKAPDKVKLVEPDKAKAAEKVPEKAAEAPAAPAKPDAAKAPEPEAKAEPEKPKAPEAPALLPPRNLTPTAREEWPKLPRAMQQEFIRVNREAQTALTKSDKERQYAAGIREVLQPYEHMLRAEGLDAPRAIGDLLRTAAALRTAPPAHKAAIIANMVTQFGVPIEALANALDNPGPTRPIGSIAPEAPAQYQGAAPQFPPQYPAQYRDPRVDELLAERQQAAKAAAEQQKAEIEDFGATHEFFEDIREEMADELERAARRGKPLTLEGAHARVLASHKVDPDSEIGKVLRQRDEAAAAKASLAQSQRAQAAATVSVKAEPAPVAVPTGKGTPLDDVKAAYARLTQ